MVQRHCEKKYKNGTSMLLYVACNTSIFLICTFTSLNVEFELQVDLSIFIDQFPIFPNNDKPRK